MRKLFIAFILLGLLAAGTFAYWTIGNRPANLSDKSTKIFVIQKGESIREVGSSLKREGLIKDPVVFFLYIKLYGQDRKIQAGDYRLSSSMTLAAVIDELGHGKLDRWITIPEGYRAEEIADVLEKNIPSYDESWREELNKNEGYLFPDTYLIPRDADIDMVISTMKNNFNHKIQEAGLTLTDQNLSRTIILASLIEREAKINEEKPLIAGVISNRLKRGMALDIDATIQYVKGSPDKWWPQITSSDYKSADSLYNTYLYSGLPPGPIANPGIEAIKAAQNPQSHSYYFYIHSGGKIYPAKTIEEHQKNIQKYL
ncbi:MAG: hypothetical protein A3C30_04645 [Candidatus Levybacteria bacterium RIFCSPHIGHO2_02_FULL_40_18]|nr:MAG: hypothetical protein A2869_02300 [Candidatus Levybacteria bacterium RIFCSPHIGHO2_01_FULL_40_58]OGH26368.1 MAG: hypothetical protein A3C30_04645 [Candidatus Levybacteria bacterium RIFCSPHIGHO2_02_FULL_40_18]OGH31815.1 MAG: hypothetical protein A3E43_00440 [Candidatus Levybacteria bacterium RIFCSPHIGHO2_12_FULL_40_31]OGH40448.1 MAG: hypothetical protein A2894_00945 [Candidatus Levybacteria bacterium RIFCSPLOWO2_01_FULL_40_64]OGH49156.1 MAG: hypothetical protein A3I54_04345 [Candidatus Lev